MVQAAVLHLSDREGTIMWAWILFAFLLIIILMLLKCLFHQHSSLTALARYVDSSEKEHTGERTQLLVEE
jgi:hypothetical protein